ncbi:phosphorylcholine transferase LicD [uncultured Anaerovibrio sp.]|uniref:LicD family protein n=1 Tax=uncultured Anaerovibrio sp. TaxID=361586 RepID=UPI0025D18F0A|nr:LicD family protein [uncultured Anaerovibrio sp.]
MFKELTRQEIQSISLGILKQVTDICEQLNLRYFIMYGTLIGVVRHKGFIPWDDDVDIMMPRPDYDKLVDHLLDNPVEYMKVFNRDTCKEYPYMITRISDDRYSLDMENEKPFGMGVFIDIYPFDGLGNTEKEALSYGMKGDRLSSLCYQATREHFAIETTTSFWRKVLKWPVYIISKMIGKDYFQNKIESLNGKYQYDESEYVGCFVWLSGGMKDIFKREWFDEYIMAKFEDYEFRIPKQFDEVLRHGYGNYMILPPEQERIGHHYYKVYKKI